MAKMQVQKRKRFTQKELMEMASDLEKSCHENHGCRAMNKRIIFGILNFIQHDLIQPNGEVK